MGAFLWPSVTPSLPGADPFTHVRVAPTRVNEYDSHYRFHSRGRICAGQMRQAMDKLRCTIGRAGRPGRRCRRARTRQGCPAARRARPRRWLGSAAGPVALTMLATGCGASATATQQRPDAINVIAAESYIEADLKALDPSDKAYFTARRKATDAAFAGIRAQLAQIRRTDAGRPVASTESIFVYLARYLGLRLISPPAFMNAVSEGNDPPAASVAEMTRQLSARQADVLVYNKQTATALTTSIRELAARNHIPVVGVTETIQPQGATFQKWFSGELT